MGTDHGTARTEERTGSPTCGLLPLPPLQHISVHCPAGIPTAGLQPDKAPKGCNFFLGNQPGPRGERGYGGDFDGHKKGREGHGDSEHHRSADTHSGVSTRPARNQKRRQHDDSSSSSREKKRRKRRMGEEKEAERGD
uniref:Uncharacterized protein n=1 Tax=Chromera velia CCMP2878 TaxID=1169474 RepID=A0A0G4HTX3_9ALVE|eukprot:Cvel_31601.t1-p1 / transcript=Cvel_31601.t1 / gene=Cvel_31601 / organism=Chromera_velia_CCMP2878 / gene_product=hypothetical protein / transcript_product=hypothetical protein / location=Cvel_scaffold4741:7074-7484(+) / protein_length=137 / sequence_SO=supercontig / SO=protein_coding / is_pseudo=false